MLASATALPDKTAENVIFIMFKSKIDLPLL